MGGGMTLLVVGLVVIVLVILVVVFLSVRSSRGAEEDDYPARPARRGRYEAEQEADGVGRRGGSRHPGGARRSTRAGSVPSGPGRDPWDDNRHPAGRSGYGAAGEYAEDDYPA